MITTELFYFSFEFAYMIAECKYRLIFLSFSSSIYLSPSLSFILSTSEFMVSLHHSASAHPLPSVYANIMLWLAITSEKGNKQDTQKTTNLKRINQMKSTESCM